MLINAMDLAGQQLDWAVAKAAGIRFVKFPWYETDSVCPLTGEWEEDMWSPSDDWAQCGALIDRYEVELFTQRTAKGYYGAGIPGVVRISSDSYLVSACRAIVVSELGREVDVPERL